MFSRNIRLLIYALLLFGASIIIWESIQIGNTVNPTDTNQIYTNNIKSVISNLCYSIWGAAFMGLCIEFSVGGFENSRIRSGTKAYFWDLEFNMKLVMGNLIWLDNRINDDDFNWDFEVEDYFTTQMETEFAEKYGQAKYIKYKEANKKLKEIGKKYSDLSFGKWDTEEIQKVKKMFQIVSHSIEICSKELRKMKDKKLLLEASNICSVEIFEKLEMCINSAKILMLTENWEECDYNYAIGELLKAYRILRNMLKPDLHVPVKWIGTYGDTGFDDIIESIL